jgi:hypothetical protein
VGREYGEKGTILDTGTDVRLNAQISVNENVAFAR